MFRLFLNSYFLKKEPISLIHYITNRCNARCKHCFMNFNDPEIFKDELTLEEIEILTKSVGKSLFNINLTGGEPFLRKDIFKIAELYLNNTSIKSIFITTNGNFTTEIKKFIDCFMKSKVRGKIIFSISIDNFEKEHDKNRGVKGLFKKAIESYNLIENYNDSDIIANICITVTDQNYDKVLNIYYHLKEMGIKAVTANLMREAGVIKKIKNKEKILKSYLALTEEIHKDQLKNNTKGFGNSLQGILMNSKNMIMNKLIPEIFIKKRFIVNCSAGSLFGVISANGDVFPCEILNVKLGNLREFNMDFMKLWENKKTKDFCKFIKKTKCTCTFECVWSVNIISNFKFVYPMLLNYYRLRWKK